MNKTAERISKIFDSSNVVRYKKGEVVIRPEVPLQQIFYLKKGFVRQYLLSKGGKELTLNVFKPHSFIPLYLVLTNTNNNYYFEALTDIEVLTIKKGKFLQHIESDHDSLAYFANVFAHATLTLSHRLEYLLCESPYEKLIAFLVYIGENLNEGQRGHAMQLTLTHYLIATWIGLSRETVTKYMIQLRKKSLIEYSNRKIVIRNMNKLKRELASL